MLNLIMMVVKVTTMSYFAKKDSFKSKKTISFRKNLINCLSAAKFLFSAVLKENIRNEKSLNTDWGKHFVWGRIKENNSTTSF